MPEHSAVVNTVCPQEKLVNQCLAWSRTWLKQLSSSSRSLLEYYCVHVCLLVSSATPWTVAHLAPLSMGFPRQEYWSRLPVPSPGDFPNRGIEPAPSALACRFFTTEPPGNPTLVLPESNQSLTDLEERKYPTVVHSSHSVPPKRAGN